MRHARRKLAASIGILLISGTAMGMYAPGSLTPPLTWSRPDPEARPAVAAASDAAFRLTADAFGRSGRMRVMVVDAGEPVELPMEWLRPQSFDVTYRWIPVSGTRQRALLGDGHLSLGVRAPADAGVWRLQLRGGAWTQDVEELTVVTRVPFDHMRNGFLNGYRIGRYWTEGEGRSDMYAPPTGFIEVTPENQDLYVSANFRLRNFLTKDQFSVWPKYLVLDMRLIDKLELVLQELNAMGVRAEHMAVMSGFRTPAYNGPGGGGRARLSRHTYGDAADVWVDNDRSGYISDLNGDGRRDFADVLVMLRAVERVERRYPELTGGAGVYQANSVRGPFIHIDARGYHSRW
jgi:hypothetical protein